MTCANCGHSGEDHVFGVVTVCNAKIDCNCIEFLECINFNELPKDYQAYMRGFEKCTEKVRWVLDNVKFTRNMKNKWFIEWYRKYIEPDRDHETISRMRRKLVEIDSTSYGPFEPSLIEQKVIKQYSMMEFVTQN